MSNEDDAYRFDSAGPKRKNFNWDVPEDKRAILACIVSGVYSLRYDQVKSYTDSDRALAPAWYEAHNYELVDLIRGKDNTRINGAVFRWNYRQHWKPPRAPMVILAFRGTTSLTSDYVIDYKIANQSLHKTARFTAAYNSLRNAVTWHGRENVCVTGHSLGAALALSAARAMASEGVFVEAHLFNPPFSSSTAPLKSLLGPGAYSGLLELYTITKHGLVKLIVNERQRRCSEAAFAALGSWYPDMYVHQKDPVCSGFLEHFMNYEYLLSGRYGKLVMPHESIRGIMFSSSAKPHHLIPSAKLHVPVEKQGVRAREAHSLTQWWSEDLLVNVRFVNLTGRGHLDHPLQLPGFQGVQYIETLAA